MFSLNKTGDWLNSLSNDKKEEYINMARKQGKQLRKKYKERIRTIEKLRQDALNKKRQELVKKEEEKFKQKEKLINDMLYFGLWQYVETVDQRLASMKTKAEKKEALKTQILFRKTVLDQKADRKLFQLSEKGAQYSIETLTENVKTLIQSALAVGPGPTEKSVFLGKKIIHYQMEDYIRKPFLGRVISSVPGYPDWYNVTYENFPDVYCYKLKEDYDNGDLEIVVEGTYKLLIKYLLLAFD